MSPNTGVINCLKAILSESSLFECNLKAFSISGILEHNMQHNQGNSEKFSEC